MNSIENKITITQPISEDILDNWENRIVNNTDSSYGTKKKTYNDETIVSKITKIVISDEDELDRVSFVTIYEKTGECSEDDKFIRTYWNSLYV